MKLTVRESGDRVRVNADGTEIRMSASEYEQSSGKDLVDRVRSERERVETILNG